MSISFDFYYGNNKNLSIANKIFYSFNIRYCGVYLYAYLAVSQLIGYSVGR